MKKKNKKLLPLIFLFLSLVGAAVGAFIFYRFFPKRFDFPNALTTIIGAFGGFGGIWFIYWFATHLFTEE